ncbi:MAG: nucleotide exchange factor GrpE [Candidatus Rokubacteria bacterium]|nr:nucleotide exchange factor GrpE [Candidatus Rokubacteria bacterium]
MDDSPQHETQDGPAAEVLDPAELKRQLDEKQDRLLRAIAEADNIRRRAQRDKEEFARFANEALLRDIIPVLDNFDRALGAARDAGEASKVVEGVELIHRELLRVLERAGVTRYSALGQRFDPNRHEAAARVVSATEPPDTVVGEIVPGYLLHGRVLRPAQVAVAAAPDEDAA